MHMSLKKYFGLILLLTYSYVYSSENSFKLVCQGTETGNLGNPVTERWSKEVTKSYSFIDSKWKADTKLYNISCPTWEEDRIVCNKVPKNLPNNLIEYTSINIDRISGLLIEHDSYDNQSMQNIVRNTEFNATCTKILKNKL